jgi:hypothetical protein
LLFAEDYDLDPAAANEALGLLVLQRIMSIVAPLPRFATVTAQT